MSACERCGTDGAFLFACPDCGADFCDDHRDPATHGCETLSAEANVEDAAPETEESDEPTDPSGDGPTSHRTTRQVRTRNQLGPTRRRGIPSQSLEPVTIDPGTMTPPISRRVGAAFDGFPSSVDCSADG